MLTLAVPDVLVFLLFLTSTFWDVPAQRVHTLCLRRLHLLVRIDEVAPARGVTSAGGAKGTSSHTCGVFRSSVPNDPVSHSNPGACPAQTSWFEARKRIRSVMRKDTLHLEIVLVKPDHKPSPVARNFQASSSMSPLTSLLVPVDLESISWEALEYAGWLAARSGAITDIFYVQPLRSDELEVPAESCDRLLSLLAILTGRFATTRKSFSAKARRLEPIFVGYLQPGDPASAIVKFATQRQHDVIVMGSRRDFSRSTPYESVSETVLRQANLPVLVVPDGPIADIAPESLRLI